jgi:bifunctional NMN adenylyltransferase/nudix hydrolase
MVISKPPIGSVMLYGSRDSFIPYYHGQFPTEELVPTSYVSATELREECGRAVKVSADFRAGVIYASQNRYPTAYPTVDVAVLRRTEGVGYEVLIARKPNEEGWRFIGGFVDPSDSSLEAAARREVLEESGANVEGFRYIGSHKIDDWRYHGEVDGIMTTFLAATFTFGIVEPKDDICELKWVPVFTGAGSDQAFGGIQFEPIHARLSTELFRFIGEQTRKELKAPCK